MAFFMEETVYFSQPACWAPGMEGADIWHEWALGKRQLVAGPESPALDFTPPLFRRRLSQLSRMTVRVVHDALENAGGCRDIPQSFVSFRGELARQLSVDMTLITELSVLPAAFSLSVFNAPIALAAIACGLKGGYSAIFPPEGCFYDGVVTALAPVLCGDESQVLFVYGDELIPEEYRGICSIGGGGSGNQNRGGPSDEDGVGGEVCGPLAFASLASLSRSEQCRIPCRMEAVQGLSPDGFLKRLLLEA